MCNFLFRLDISQSIGTGHLRRCMVLAKSLKELGAKIFFACRIKEFERPEELMELCDGWFSLQWSVSIETDAHEVVKLCKQYRIDVAVIDHYRVDVNYQKILLKSHIRWLQFDGVANMPMWADWVLNQRLDANLAAYKPISQRAETQFLLGPSYALLREEFRVWRNRSDFNHSVGKILLTFGGGNDRGATVLCLEALKNINPAIECAVLVTTFNPRLKDIVGWVDRNKHTNVNLLINERNIARLMSTMDMAIIAGGMTAFEIAAMGLPGIIIQIAENQNGNAIAFNESKASAFLGPIENLTLPLLEKRIQEILINPQVRKSMSHKGQMLVDTKGAKRVAEILHFQARQ